MSNKFSWPDRFSKLKQNRTNNSCRIRCSRVSKTPCFKDYLLSASKKCRTNLWSDLLILSQNSLTNWHDRNFQPLTQQDNYKSYWPKKNALPYHLCHSKPMNTYSRTNLNLRWKVHLSLVLHSLMLSCNKFLACNL